MYRRSLSRNYSSRVDNLHVNSSKTKKIQLENGNHGVQTRKTLESLRILPPVNDGDKVMGYKELEDHIKMLTDGITKHSF